MSESANACQAHNDPVDPRSDDGEEAPLIVKTTRFLRMLPWMLLFSRQLNWMQLHFALTHGTIILTLVHNWYKQVHKLIFFFWKGQRKRKG